MGTKVKKGLFKPLKYFSNIFDNKEPELQIGFPTDVKHVAHIGWDGPNVNAPTWMREYHSVPLNTSCAEGREIPAANPWGSQEFVLVDDSPVHQAAAPCRNSSSIDNGLESSNGGTTSSKPRHSRRHQSDGTITDSPGRDGSEGSRRGRRHRKKEGAADTSGQDLPAIPKQSHRRKTKGSSGSGGSKKTSSTDAAEGGSTEGMPKLHGVAGKDEEEL